MFRLVVLTSVALCGFAANSLLCRRALGSQQIDAATFVLLRLASGALVLTLLSRRSVASATRGGSALSAGALFAYAIAFSIAYLKINAGVGALVLFGAVQLTMIGSALLRGERPRRAEWLGLAIASGGLVALIVPGLWGRSALLAPDATGVALMAAAGAAWGVYSLRGRAASSPLLATAGNFVRTVPFAIGAELLWLLLGRDLRVSLAGAFLAVTSGAITSGVCYAVWYAVLPRLGATRAAIVQLSVPALAALGGVLLLGETLTLRLVVAGSAILGGVALAVAGRRSS